MVCVSCDRYFKRPTYFNVSANYLSNIYLDNGKSLFLGDLTGGTSASINYNNTTKYLTIASGINSSNIYLRTNNASGMGTYIDITPTTCTIPQTLSIPSYSNVTSALDTLYTSITGINTSISNINATLTDISYSSNLTTISNDVTITGAGKPITLYPRMPPGSSTNTVNGIIMVNNGNIKGGLINEVDQLVSYGINTPQFSDLNTRDMTKVGGLFRMDTRVLHCAQCIHTNIL